MGRRASSSKQCRSRALGRDSHRARQGRRLEFRGHPHHARQISWKPDLPSPGAEIAGVIESISGERPKLSPGQSVMAYVNWGGARQKITVDASALIPVPASVPLITAAGLSVTYGTATHGLSDRGGLKPGEAVVVTGAAGGAGQAAIEIAKLMGARVIAVASSPEKCAVAKPRVPMRQSNFQAPT